MLPESCEGTQLLGLATLTDDFREDNSEDLQIEKKTRT